MLDAIEAVPDAFVLFDSEDRLVTCNDKYRELFPLSAAITEPSRTFEEIIRLGVAAGKYDLGDKDKEAWVSERLRLHANPGPAVEQHRRSGRWLRIQEARTREGGIGGFHADITEQKEREFNLARLDAMRRAINTALDCIVTIDQAGRIVEFNPAAEITLGYKRDEAEIRESQACLASAQQMARLGNWIWNL